MPQRDAERLAESMLIAVKPWLVQFIEQLPTGTTQATDGLSEADEARLDRSLAKLRPLRPNKTNQPRESTPRNAKRPTG